MATRPRQSTRQRHSSLPVPWSPPSFILIVILVAATTTKPCSAGVFGRHSTPAAIFGNLLGNRDEAAKPVPPQLMPPPPPSHQSGNERIIVDAGGSTSNNMDHFGGEQQQQQTQQYSSHPLMNEDQSDGNFLPPPPPPYDGSFVAPSVSTMDQHYHHQQQQQRDEDIHLRQLDVLTERIMELETTAATDRNMILEWQQNCTALMNQVASLEDGMEDERTKCQALQEQYTLAVTDQDRLKNELKVAMREAEDLAALIEKHRLLAEDEDETFRKKKTKKRRGLVAWLFGWGTENDDDDLDDAYGEARSTLLKALQTERNSVDELESAVASLQQNNSAIAEQVQSRDTIIDELNDRIAIFEEDKIVLKAALKQLQKEMKEEAPKTQKLVDDYKVAQREIKRLQQDTEAMIMAHEHEIELLQQEIFLKQRKIEEAEGNLTEIGSYVDKLESRLADFSVARRDIEKREQQCQELEAASSKAIEERDYMKSQLDEYEKEREEHKQLLQELVTERSSLKSQTDRSGLEQNAMRLRGSLAKLEIDYKALDKVNQELQSRIHDLEAQERSAEALNRTAEAKLISMEEQMNDLQSTLDGQLREKEDLAMMLRDAESHKAELLGKINHLSQVVESETTATDDVVKGLKASLQSSTEEILSLQKNLVAKEADLNKANKELDAAQQETKRLETSLHDRMSYQHVVIHKTPQVVVSNQEFDFDEFETDPQIHMSMRNLSPNVLSVPCRSQSFTVKPFIEASSPVVVPFQGPARHSLVSKSGESKRAMQHLLHGRQTSEVNVADIKKRNGAGQVQGTEMTAQPVSLSSDPRGLNATLSWHHATANQTVSHTSHRHVSNTTERTVPFRRVRKFFAKSTGIHGLLRKPSSSPTNNRQASNSLLKPREVVPAPAKLGQSRFAAFTRSRQSQSASAALPGLQRGQVKEVPNAISKPLGPIRQQHQLVPDTQRLPATARQTRPSFISRAPLRPNQPERLHSSTSAPLSNEAKLLPNQAVSAKRSFGGGLMQPPPSDELMHAPSDTKSDR